MEKEERGRGGILSAELGNCFSMVLRKFLNSSVVQWAIPVRLHAREATLTRCLPLISSDSFSVTVGSICNVLTDTCPCFRQVSIASVSPTESTLQKKQRLQNIFCSFFRIQNEVTNPQSTIKMIKCKHYWGFTINILCINMFSEVLLHFYCFSIWLYSILAFTMK